MLSLNFNVIKISGQVIKDIQTNQQHKDMVVDLVKRCKTTNTMTIAEKVDTKELLDYVTDLGIDKIQGYYYSEPINCNSFLANYKTNYKQDEVAD